MECRIPNTNRFAEPAGLLTAPESIPWNQFKRELRSVYEPPSCAKATRAKLEQVLRGVDGLPALDDNGKPLVDDNGKPVPYVQSTADLNTGMIARFCASRPPGQSEWTLQSLLMSLRSACNFAAASGYTRISPFAIRRLSRWVQPLPPSDKRHLSKEELRALLDLLARDVEDTEGWRQWRARRLQAVVATLAYTGLRRSECLRAHVGDIDLDRRVIWLTGHGQKLKTAGSNKPVPIPNALVPILTSWMAHRLDAPFGFPLPKTCDWLIPTVSRKSCWTSGHEKTKPLYRLKFAGARVGIADINFQMLRRSWATHAESSWGFGEGLIQRVLRHSSPMTSRKFYRQADVANLVNAVAAVDF